jgi:hypothetical protein
MADRNAEVAREIVTAWARDGIPAWEIAGRIAAALRARYEDGRRAGIEEAARVLDGWESMDLERLAKLRSYVRALAGAPEADGSGAA